MAVVFEDFSVEVKQAMSSAAEKFLTEAASEIKSRAQRNSRVRTGQTKGSYDYQIEELEASIGSPLENAIWEEFGTGEYAAEGNGRKGGWFYEDEEGTGHFTHGKTANHPLQRAFDSLRQKLKNRANQIFKEEMK